MYSGEAEALYLYNTWGIKLVIQRKAQELVGLSGNKPETSTEAVVNIPIYSPFSSFIIYSLNYFPDIFSIYLFKAYYLEVMDIFLHFSIKNALYLLGTCSNVSRTCSDILGNSLFRQAASKALYSAQISACRLNHYLT